MDKAKETTTLKSKENGDTLLPNGFVLETCNEKRVRRRSLWIMYFTTFLQSLAGSVVITGMWPYLQQLDRGVNVRWYGLVVAANPLGQLISSPLIGWVCNRVGATRGPSLFCLLLFILANSWFALLPLHQSHAKWFIILARFVVGVSSGSITVCRTFVTQGTLVGERTAAIAHLSLSQAVGFVMGPVGQLLLKPLGEEGFRIGQLPVNMYTSVGWFTAALGLINLIFFHPKFFHESDIAIREAQGKAKISEAQKDGKVSVTYNLDKASPKLDYIALSSIAFTFFIVFLEFVLLETLGTPVSMDQFGWSASKSITNVGWTMILSSIVSTSIFFIIPKLAARFDERLLLLVCGLVPYTFGRLFFFPFPNNDVSPQRVLGCVSEDGSILDGVSFEECEGFEDAKWKVLQEGCAPEQTWCFEIPALSPILVAVGYGILTLGFPFCIALTQTLFSKVLGPRPQGVWMGGLTAISSLARVIGPIFITDLYRMFGTYVISGTALGLMLAVILVMLLTYKRLVPAGKVQACVDKS